MTDERVTLTEENHKRLMRVTSQSTLSSWINKKGGETTLYEVEAVDENGEIIDLPLRTFAAELPTDEVLEYELRRYEHPEHGVSWTVKRPNGGLGKRVSELEAEVARLVERISELESRLSEPAPHVHPAQTDPDKPRGPEFF